MPGWTALEGMHGQVAFVRPARVPERRRVRRWRWRLAAAAFADAHRVLGDDYSLGPAAWLRLDREIDRRSALRADAFAARDATFNRARFARACLSGVWPEDVPGVE